MSADEEKQIEPPILTTPHGLKKYDGTLETIVHGYLRFHSKECDIFLPSDVQRVCYLWVHPRSIFLNVKTPSGHCPSVIAISSDTVAMLKQEIENKEGIPANQQILQLAYLGKILRDELTLSDYNLHTNDLINLLLRLHGNENAI